MTASGAASAANPPATAQVQLRDPCFYIFTSGTPGLPKASRMPHYRWMRSMAGVGQLAVPMRRDDVLYCELPLYHNHARTAVRRGGTEGCRQGRYVWGPSD